MRANGLAPAVLALLLALTGGASAQQPVPATAAKPAQTAPITPAPKSATLAPPAKLAPLPARPAAPVLPVNAAPPPAPEPIPLSVRAGDHTDFGRLVIDAPNSEPLAITATSDESNVIIRFSRPVDINQEAILKRLGKYLADLTMSPDHLSLSGLLRRPADVKQSSFEHGSVVLDFTPKAKKSETALKPAEAPKPVAAVPPAVPQTAVVKPAATPASPQTVAVKPPAKPVPHRPALASRVIVAKSGATDHLTIDLPRSVTADLTEKDGRAQIALSRPIGLNIARVNAAVPEALRPFALTDDGSTVGFALPAGRHAQLRRQGAKLIADIGPASAPPPVKAAAPAVAPAAPAPVAAVVPPAATPQIATASPAMPPPGPALPEPNPAPAAPLAPVQSLNGVLASADNLQLLWTLAGENLSLRFEWQEPTSAAMFRRGDAVWIVFNKKSDLDVSRFSGQNLPVVTSFQKVQTLSGLALRLAVWPSFNPVIHRAGNAWIVDMVSQPVRPMAPVSPVIKRDGTINALDYNVFNPASPISIDDPQSDETLVAVPLPQLGQGVLHSVEMPDLDTLATAQGLAFIPHSDALQIQTSESLVEISAPDGLTISSDADRNTAASAPAGDDKLLFNFADWAGSPDGSLAEQRQALLHRIINAPDERRLAARLDLAHYYAANAQAPETLGVLSAIQRDTPEAFDTPGVRALRGVANEILGRTADAGADLDDKSLDKEGEVSLWRAAEAADRHDLKTMAANYSLGKAYLGGYPPELRHRLELQLADALLDAGDQASAQPLIDDVQSTQSTRGQMDEAKFLAGRIAAAKGDAAGAVDLWTQVVASPLLSKSRVQSGYALALAKLDAGKASVQDTIKTLDMLRYSWRGDSFEIQLLRKLAALQIRDGNYAEGFSALRTVLANYPDSPETRGITQEMQQDFADIFIGPQAKDVQPATALTVYDEFKELLPSGPAGDAINRSLTDRLVALGLMDRAGGMLEDDVRHRLSGIDQAKAAVRLALVRLFDHKPQGAIDALDLAGSTAMPPDLARQSQQFRARALFELGQSDAALKLLTADDSADARKLRLYIYWQTHNWPAAANALMADLQATPAHAQIDDATAGKIINLATAMALSNNRAGLASLQSNWGGAMRKTSYQTDFHALVDAGSVGATGLGNLSGEGPESFLDTYRQRVNRNGLSSIN